MQLTDPRPAYRQIWNYRDNVDAAVELIGEKLAQAKAYPAQQVDSSARKFTSYELKMDTYSLYNSGHHYWEWISGDEEGAGDWEPRVDPENKNYKHTGSAYADKADEIESNPPKDF
jgi:hypothetical protein